MNFRRKRSEAFFGSETRLNIKPRAMRGYFSVVQDGQKSEKTQSFSRTGGTDPRVEVIARNTQKLLVLSSPPDMIPLRGACQAL